MLPSRALVYAPLQDGVALSSSDSRRSFYVALHILMGGLSKGNGLPGVVDDFKIVHFTDEGQGALDGSYERDGARQ